MPWSIQLVADRSVDYTPTPDPERMEEKFPEMVQPHQKSIIDRRSLSRAPEDLPPVQPKAQKVPRGTLFEPTFQPPPPRPPAPPPPQPRGVPPVGPVQAGSSSSYYSDARQHPAPIPHRPHATHDRCT